MRNAQRYLTPIELDALRKRNAYLATGLVAHAWIVIFASMALFVWLPNPLTWLLTAALIGGRQLGLAILMHDGAHGLLYRHRKLNHHVSQWLLGWPIGADMPSYRQYHLQHHARTQQHDDPDLVLSASFPVSRASFYRKIWRDLSGQTGFAQRSAQLTHAFKLKGAGKSDSNAARGNLYRQLHEKLGGIFAVNLMLLVILSLAGYWWLYPLLWLLPLLTFFQLFLRLRNAAEHAMVGDANDPFAHARTTLAGPLARIFIAPYWVNYHVEHHLLMAIPCYRLKKCHRLLTSSGAAGKMLVSQTYTEVFRLLTSRADDDQQGRRKQTGNRRYAGLVMEEDPRR